MRNGHKDRQWHDARIEPACKGLLKFMHSIWIFPEQSKQFLRVSQRFQTRDHLFSIRNIKRKFMQ